jgi:hypothetical protein
MTKPANFSFEQGFASWSRMLSKSKDKPATLTVIAEEAARFISMGCPKQLAADEATERAISYGLAADVVQEALADALDPPLRVPWDAGKRNGTYAPNRLHATLDLEAERPPPTGPILTLAEWLARDLPVADPILGHWLTTTSRVLLTAPTGLGKTMLGVGVGFAISAGTGFLHWRGIRPARVLFIDGEMSGRLLKQRLADEASRLGIRPDGMHAFSHEDVENFAPLNTPAGHACINAVIERIGELDLILTIEVYFTEGRFPISKTTARLRRCGKARR